MSSTGLVCMGLCTLDLLGRLPSYPEKNSKAVLASTTFQGGGPAATAAATAARLGCPTRFVGKVGDDAFGRLIVEGLAEVGVDVRHVVLAPGQRSPFSFVAIDEGDASRTVFHSPGPELVATEVDWSCLDGAGALLVDTRQPLAQIEAARRARASGVPIVVDAESLRPGTREILAEHPILIASARFGSELRPGAPVEEQLAAMLALGAETAIITLGEEGSIGLHGGELIRQQAFPVNAVDTTGCGDVYHGAFAAALLSGCSIPRAMAFAAAAAALKCRSPGGRAGLPTLDEVLAVLDGGSH